MLPDEYEGLMVAGDNVTLVPLPDNSTSPCPWWWWWWYLWWWWWGWCLSSFNLLNYIISGMVISRRCYVRFIAYITYEREQTRFIHLRWSCWWWHQAEEDAQSSVGSRLFVTLAYHGSMLLHLTIPSLFYFIVPYRGYVVILWLAYQFHPTISTLPCLVAII